MPIRPENRARYPKEWKSISHNIRFERANGRCECLGECGDDHGIQNDAYGFHIWADHRSHDDRCMAHHGEQHFETGSKVILTVAHLDHQPENNDGSNLKAMCQRCHNKYDGPMRRAGIKERAKKAKELKQPTFFKD